MCLVLQVVDTLDIVRSNERYRAFYSELFTLELFTYIYYISFQFSFSEPIGFIMLYPTFTRWSATLSSPTTTEE